MQNAERPGKATQNRLQASYSGADPGLRVPGYGSGAFSAFCIFPSAFSQKLLSFYAWPRYVVALGKHLLA
jgi:hypothetical protein